MDKIENENEDAARGLAFLEPFWKKKAAWDKNFVLLPLTITYIS